MRRVRAATTAAAAALLVMVMMMSDCQAGRVYFPGPSIGPAPPTLWHSLHTIRQARRLDAEDDGAPELRAAGVRIGQKYSDLEEPALLEPQQQHDGGLQPLQDGDLEDLQPLEPLDISEPHEIRGHLDVQQDDDPLPLRVTSVEHQQDSDNLQSLAPLPVLLAVEPRGAEFSSDAQTVIPDTRVSNSIIEGQHLREFVAFDDSRPVSDPAINGYSAPDPADIISLEEASDVSQPVFVTGQIPEGVVYAPSAGEDANFGGGLSGEFHLPSRERHPPLRQDLQSSASVLDSTSVERPEQRPSFRRPPIRPNPAQPRPASVAVAEGPLQSDQNLLNLLVTQGVLRPVGRVRVARLRLVTDDKEKEDEEQVERSVFFAPARSDDGEVIVELDVGGEPSEALLDDRRRYREGPNKEALLELRDEREEAEYEEEDGNGGWQAPAETNDEREQVLSTNIVPILSEKEVFDQLVTPRASSSSTITGTGSDTVSESGEEPVDTEVITRDVEDQRRPVLARRTDSLAARLTELGSRVSRQGVWGRRLSGAALRRPTEAADSGRQDDRQDARHGGWQRRIDIGEPVFVDTDSEYEAEDLDTEGSERHEEVVVLDEEGNVLHEELAVIDEKAGEREEELAGLDEEDSERPEAVVGVDEEGNVRWEATSAATQPTRSDILTERTVSFRTDSSIEDEETGPPQLVAEMHNCPELGGTITLECRIKNAPEHDELKRFWWMRRRFDGEDNAVRDELLAVNGVNQHTTSNTSVQQVTAGHQLLTVTAVEATDTGLYMCQAGWADTLQEVEMLVFLCH